MGLKLKQAKDGSYHVSGVVNGQRIRRSLKTEVRRIAEEKRVALEYAAMGGAGGRFRTMTVAEVIADYKAARGHRISRPHEYVLGRIEAAFGGKAADALTAGEFGAWLNSEWVRSKPSTRRLVAQRMTTIMNHACANGWRRAWRFTPPSGGPKRLRYLSAEEIKTLRYECPEYLWPLFVFLLHTGCRVGEAVRLDWSDVDFRAKTVRLWTRKGTGEIRERHVPLNRDALKAVIEQARLNRKVRLKERVGPLFLNTQGMRWAGARGIEYAVEKLRVEAGVEPFRVHDLRHTFASHLRARRVPLDTIASLMGITNMATVQVYAHLGPTEEREAVDTLTSGV